MPLSPIRRRHIQRGFSMIELTVVMAIAAVSAVLGARYIADEALSATGEGTASYLNTLSGAVSRHMTVNYNALGNGQAVAGFANALQPTIAELRTAGALPAGFPNFAPFNIAASIRIDRVGCPGLGCRLDGVIWLNQPLRDSGARPLLWLANEIRAATEGGVASDFSAPGTLRGPTGTVNNPLGSEAATVGALTTVDTAIFNQFVRRNDTRLTELNEALTVNAGPLATGGNALQVNGNQSTTGNASIAGTASIDGAITASSTLAATGAITSSNSVGASSITACLRSALENDGDIVSRAANCVERVRITNAGVDVRDAAGTSMVNLDGTGRVTAQRVRVSVSASRGGACTVDGDVVADADTSGTIVVCRGGVWRAPGWLEASAGATCSPVGSVARTSTNQALICRSDGITARWYLLTDRITPAVPMEVWSGNGAGNVPRPVCGAGGAADILAAALQGGSDYGTVPPRNRFEVRVGGTGPWTVTPMMVDQSGGAFTSDPSGVPYNLGWTAVTYCRYPA